MGKSKEQKQQQDINLGIARQQALAQQQAMQQAIADQQRQQELFGQITPFAQQLMGIGSQAAQGNLPEGYLGNFAGQASDIGTSALQGNLPSNYLDPFSQQALNIGTGALSGQLPQPFLNAFQAPARNAISSAYKGGAGNLLESLSQGGQYGSGLSAGPLASFFGQQAHDVSQSDAQANLQALMQALGLGQFGSQARTGALQQLQGMGQYGSQARLQALGQLQGLGLQGVNALQGQQSVFNPASYSQLGIQAGGAGSVDPRQYARAGGGILGSILGVATSAGLGALTGGASLAGNLPVNSGRGMNFTSLNQYNPASYAQMGGPLWNGFPSF